MSDHPVLLYDGACGFCAWWVRLVLRHEGQRTLRFAPLEGVFAQQLRQRHASLAGVDSLVWVEPAAGSAPERVFVRSAGALRVARYLGGAWHLARLLAIVPVPIRDAAYDVVARHRHQLSREMERCLLIPPAELGRFLP